jgi:hypothetical protein
LFGPQNSLFWNLLFLSSYRQPFGSLIVYGGNLPEKYTG